MNKEKLIDISSGISPLGPSRKVKAAIRKAVKGINNQPEKELPRLRRSFESRFGFSEKSMIFANSRKELFYLITETYDAGKVAVLGPSSGIFENAPASLFREITYINADETAGFIADPLLVIPHLEINDLLFISNPNNVTGRSVSRTALSEILSHAEEKKVRVVLDEALIEFTGDDSYQPELSRSDNLISVRTTANFYGLPGLELAYAVSSPAVISELEKRKHSAVNNLAIEAARTGFKDKAYRRLVLKYISEEKKIVLKALEKFRDVKVLESDCNVMLIKLYNHADEIMSSLEGKGFIAKDNSDIDGISGKFIRFSLMKHEYNRKFIKALYGCLHNIVADL